MDLAPRGPRHQQEQLIYTLKQQIDGLDQQTQSLLKDTLYRISRNANAAVSPSLEFAIFTGRMLAALFPDRVNLSLFTQSQEAIKYVSQCGSILLANVERARKEFHSSL